MNRARIIASIALIVLAASVAGAGLFCKEAA